MRTFLTLLLCFYSITGFNQDRFEDDSFSQKELMNSPTEKQKDGNSSKTCSTPIYGEYFHLPLGLNGYFDFEQGLACAKESNKPNLVCFVGQLSVNSREMEAYVWSDTEISKLLSEKFVITALYTDDKFQLLEEKQIKSEISGKLLKRIGDKALYYQELKFKSNTQPAYYIINSKEEILAGPYYFDLSIDAYKKFLEKGLKNY